MSLQGTHQSGKTYRAKQLAMTRSALCAVVGTMHLPACSGQGETAASRGMWLREFQARNDPVVKPGTSECSVGREHLRLRLQAQAGDCAQGVAYGFTGWNICRLDHGLLYLPKQWVAGQEQAESGSVLAPWTRRPVPGAPGAPDRSPIRKSLHHVYLTKDTSQSAPCQTKDFTNLRPL